MMKLFEYEKFDYIVHLATYAVGRYNIDYSRNLRN
jgi:hypothetical protein